MQIAVSQECVLLAKMYVFEQSLYRYDTARRFFFIGNFPWICASKRLSIAYIYGHNS